MLVVAGRMNRPCRHFTTSEPSIVTIATRAHQPSSRFCYWTISPGHGVMSPYWADGAIQTCRIRRVGAGGHGDLSS